MKLLLGSNNKHKVKEMQQILDEALPGKIELLTLNDVMDDPPDVDENGTTLEKNAWLKASEYNDMTGIPCIADDTGLEIDALDGAPGVYSARYSGVHGRDDLNRAKVLEQLKNVPAEKRTARFRTVICYVDKDEVEYIAGECEGVIISEEKGSAGFGYDPIFMPAGYDRTFAEMEEDEKNAISHRGNAIRNFVGFIRNKV